MTDDVILLAYADRQSVRPGETINLQVSCQGSATYTAQMVRLLSPEVGPGPHTPEFGEVPMASSVNGDHPAQWQPIHPGSFVHIPVVTDLATPDGFTLVLSIFPTRLQAGRQMLLGAYADRTRSGFGLVIEPDGRLGLVTEKEGQTTTVHSRGRVPEDGWTRVAVAVDKTGETTFSTWSVPGLKLEETQRQHSQASIGHTPRLGSGSILIGAGRDEQGAPRWCFNGRIERPRIFGRVLQAAELTEAFQVNPTEPLEGVLADWDFSIGIDGEKIVDVSGSGLHGTTENLPTRGVGGSVWSGETVDWRARLNEYGAIHFHEDDLLDAGWETSISLQVPEDWPSGCYAGRFRAGAAEFYVPFAVRAPQTGPTAQAVFLLPTATYCAYANLRLRVTSQWNELIHGRLTVLDETDLLMLRVPEMGLSTYDSHSDGSTVVFSSMHRPVTNFRPKGRIYKFCQDLLIVAWLENLGINFDILTDEDLDREGQPALEGYRVVITSSHHEYVSTGILDALEAFTRQGGRMLNLGGNIFWHRMAYHPTRAGVGEIRRPDLPRLWQADPSQGHHSFTGETAGTWIGIGRPPHLLAGSGFITQGFDECSYYRRSSHSHDPRAEFIFQGVEDEIIGDFGILQGGAAGYEIDRADAGLGTPAHALVVASSENHSNLYDLMVSSLEDTLPVSEPGLPDRIRADMVFFETPGGGAVFSVGSIAWSGSLSYNGYENNVAQVSQNVLNRFLDAQPFTLPDHVS